MKIQFWPVCGMLLAMPGLLPAQQSRLTGPVAGFVFDGPARVVRPIQGVPGAALLGEPLSFGFDLAAAYVSPRQDAAFLVGADGSLHLFRFAAGTVTEIGLGGLSGVPQAVVFSPSGTAAALVAQGKARVIQGLPGTPQLVATVSLPSAATATPRNVLESGRVRSSRTGNVEMLAVSDDGGYLLALAGGAVRLLSIHGENRSLLPAGADALLAFAPGGHDAAVMDPGAGLTLIRDATGTATAQLLAAADDNLAGPSGLAFSQDQQSLYVASAGAHSVAAFALRGGSRTAIPCACTPAALVPMGSLFRLNELSASPLWLLEAAGSTPRTVFVPARAE